MRIFKNNEELKELIKDGWIRIDDDIYCPFDINIDASIKAYNIDALNIEALNIEALNINASNINAHNINARNIDAYSIDAKEIKYYAFCIAYQSLKCESIGGRRTNSFHKCLDQPIEFKELKKIITIDGKDIEISNESFEQLKNQLIG